MGSFFLTSKKASVTLVFLVISVLIVSSGVIITNEIRKSDNENNIGTGLVLLDNEQNNLDTLSNPSDDKTKLFTFGDSEGESSSKKSSGGEESSKDSQTYNEPEIPSDDEIIDNETSDNQTETNYTDEINVTGFSDGQIFEQNGTTYIMRDSAVYALASNEQIRFSPFLPLSICVEEKIDIKIIGSLSPSLNVNGVFACLYADYVGADIELEIMEDDLIGDDLIASETFHVSVDCDTPKVDYSKIFEEIVLSSQFGGTADQSRIEVYGSIKLTSSHLYDLEYSTSTYEVDKADCDCLSGACCDLSSRPYEFKPPLSQPTGYTDYYYCSGTNSPTRTNYCVERDFYCTGNSAGYSYSNSNVDTCGICEYCTARDSTCNYYGTSTVCGTKDCDSLDTSCRDYHDVGKYCSAGTCVSPSCTSYTNEPKHTSCGTNNECDSSGTCITCTSHSYVGCSYDDVYWYDACDNKEEKKQECGNDGCSDWYRDTCHGDDAYETQLCFNKGCTTTTSLGVHCYSNRYENERFVETCQYGCNNGQCQSNPDIACHSNSDCGTDGPSGDPFCSDDDVYRWIIEYTCNNPGTEKSYCSDEVYSTMTDDCREDSYSDDYCYDDDVYQNFTDKGCLDGVCFENTIIQFVQECGAEGCLDGECVYVECYEDTDCGSDYCENWQDNYCEDGDVYHNKTCHDMGCSDGACFDNEYIEEEKVQECGNKVCIDGGCISGDFPDLEVSNLKLMWPPNPKVGEITSFEFMIKNIGKKGAENVEFNLDTGEFNWNSPQSITLGVGEEIYVAYDHTYNNLGIYIVTAIIDPENQIKEPNENNNQISIIVMIS